MTDKDDNVLHGDDPRFSKVGGDARKALVTILDRLIKGGGYYIWTPIGDPPVWILRVPDAKKADDQWQKKEKADFVHLCHPIKFLEALENNKREDLTMYSGYVKDAQCIRCNREAPKDVERKIQIMMKLHTLDQKIS